MALTIPCICKFWHKNAIIDSTPAEKWFGPGFSAPWNFLNKFLTTLVIWDTYAYGGGNFPSDVYFSVLDEQNAEIQLITLIT